MAKQQSSQLTFGLIVLDPEQHRIEAMRKQRRCLSCQEQFGSTGPGNRICSLCRNSEVWKAGVSEFSIDYAAF